MVPLGLNLELGMGMGGGSGAGKVLKIPVGALTFMQLAAHDTALAML